MRDADRLSADRRRHRVHRRAPARLSQKRGGVATDGDGLLGLTPAVSIVVPTRNRAHLLPRLLRNLGDQDVGGLDGGLEIIVVDDASTDGTEALLEAWLDPRLRVIRHAERTGVSQARNDGTTSARGHWIAWCDDDDLWAPNKLRLQVKALIDAPGSGWCNGGAVHIDGDLNVRGFSPCPEPGDVSMVMLATNVITGGGSGVLVDRALAAQVGGFATDLSIYADWDYWARLASVSPLAVVDVPLVAYMNHPASMSHDGPQLLAEFQLLQEHLAAIHDDGAHQPHIDTRALGIWMLYQQVGTGSLVNTAWLVRELLRRKMLSPVWAPYFMLGTVAPRALLSVRNKVRRRRRSRDAQVAMYERRTSEWLPKVAASRIDGS